MADLDEVYEEDFDEDVLVEHEEDYEVPAVRPSLIAPPGEL